jgi:hypothetical protein
MSSARISDLVRPRRLGQSCSCKTERIPRLRADRPYHATDGLVNARTPQRSFPSQETPRRTSLADRDVKGGATRLSVILEASDVGHA